MEGSTWLHEHPVDRTARQVLTRGGVKRLETVSGMRQCHVWHEWRCIGLTCILLLIIAAVAIREAEHASQVQHIASHLFASVSPGHHLKVG